MRILLSLMCILAVSTAYANSDSMSVVREAEYLTVPVIAVGYYDGSLYQLGVHYGPEKNGLVGTISNRFVGFGNYWCAGSDRIYFQGEILFQGTRTIGFRFGLCIDPYASRFVVFEIGANLDAVGLSVGIGLN